MKEKTFSVQQQDYDLAHKDVSEKSELLGKPLTRSEQRIIDFILKQRTLDAITDPAIASKLNLAESTVNNQLQNIYNKTGIHKKFDLAIHFAKKAHDTRLSPKL